MTDLRFSEAFELASDGVVVLDTVSLTVLYQNPAAQRLLERISMVGEKPWAWQSLMATQETALRDIAFYLTQKQRIAYSGLLGFVLGSRESIFEIKARLLGKSRDDDKATDCLLLMLNLVGRSEAEYSPSRLNQIYSLLSETNKAVANSQTRTDLFESICRIAVNMGGFRMAWIGIRHGGQVIPVSWAGEVQDYLKGFRIRLDVDNMVRGPVGQAMTLNEVRCVNDTRADPSFAPWRDAALQRGYHSMAAIPIRVKGEPVGVFGLYSSVAYYFTVPMVELLENMAEDLSLGLRHIDEETKRIEMEGKYRQLFQAVEHSTTAVTITDESGVIEYVNPQFCTLTGYPSEDIVGATLSELATTEDSRRHYEHIEQQLLEGKEWQGELQGVTADGREIWMLQHIAPIRDARGDITHFVSTASDITELHQAQALIERLAYYDELTGLPNRRLFYDRLDQAILSATRNDTRFGLCFLDLDGFKNINDSLGHEAGDLLLKEVAHRLREAVRQKDTVSRLGGDEFTLILTDVRQPEDIAVVARNIISSLAAPITLGDNPVVVTTSIGVALFPEDGQGMDDLTRHADMAMYHAKAAGRNNYQFFTADMNQKVQARMEMEQRLRRALEQGEFCVRYQPIIDAVDGSVLAIEAIPVWMDPLRGDVSSFEYLPLAEETGMLADIGQWVLSKVCEDAVKLGALNAPKLRMSVDMDAYQFRHLDQFLASFNHCLTQFDLKPEQFQFEINESLLSKDVKKSVSILRQLRAQGCHLAVDNFGMGYSSLRYLKRFPVDMIKIDRSFVSDVGDDENDAAITSAIIALAHQLDFKVLAEGVENRKHLQFLERYWCDYLQGDYYCRPVAINECVTYIQRNLEQI